VRVVGSNTSKRDRKVFMVTAGKKSSSGNNTGEGGRRNVRVQYQENRLKQQKNRSSGRDLSGG